VTKEVKLYTEGAIDALEIVIRRLPETKEKFLKDEVLVDATLMRMLEAGEYLARIRDKYPDYYEENHSQAWFKLIGMRNVIAHGYLQVNLDKVWETIVNNVPSLIKNLKDLI